jgi:hypothetical protein
MAYKTFVNGFPLNASEINNNLMNQVISTFADASARSTAITAPVEGQVTYLTGTNDYWKWDGSAWVEFFPESTATSSPNYVINGGFDFFQRGSSGSLALSAAGYSVDRWYSSRGGAGGVTVSQQQTGSPVGSNYHARVAFTADGSFSNLFHALEAGEVNTLQGKTVTLSVKLRRNATFSAQLNVSLQKNATANTLSGGTWTALDTIFNPNASLPTGTTSADWLTCTLTATIPDDGTANGLRIVISETATSLNGAYYEVAEVQLEAGSTATPFRRNANSLQGELAACQRYYYRINANDSYSYLTNPGYADGSTLVVCGMVVPSTMRINPTSVEYSGIRVAQGTTNYAVSALAVSGNSSSASLPVVAATTSGVSSNTSYILRADNNSNAYIGISAEL